MANRASITAEVDPISRIEGHLGVKVTTNASGIITEANAHGNLWRGFENFLLGRAVNDAITFTQRICGVCPVPHGLTSTHAVDAVLGYSRGHITFANLDAADLDPNGNNYGIPPKAVLIRNLVLSAEFLMSSITHFYHLAAPSYVQGPAIPPWTPYFDNTYYSPVLLSSATGSTGPLATIAPEASAATTIWDAVIISYVRALRIRRLVFEAGALFAGRMPMTSCFVGGGVTNPGTENLAPRVAQFRTIIQEVGTFIVQEYVPIALVLGLLYPDFDSNTPTGPLAATTGSTMKSNNRGIGAGLGNFLAWGALPAPTIAGALTLPGGFKGTGATNFTVLNKADVYAKFLKTATNGTTNVPDNLTEDITHSRYGISSLDAAVYTASSNGNNPYPGKVTRTKPQREKAGAYTYMKAPRWNGVACEVGPFARLAVAGIVPVDGSSLWFSAPGVPRANALGAAAGIYFNAGFTALETTLLASTIVTGLSNASVVTSVTNWIANLKGGLSTMDRLRARAFESLYLVQKMVGTLTKTGTGATAALHWASDGWIDDAALLTTAAGSTCRSLPIPVGTVQNWGACEAPRGALMHQAKITGGKIVGYQCIVPTTWNGSPKDAAGNRGAMEACMVGIDTGDLVPFSDAGAVFTKQGGAATTAGQVQGGVEVMRIAQSFDPCIACAIH